MKQALLACEIIRHELETVIAESKEDIDVFWLGEALHEHPEKLHAEIQKYLDELSGYDRIAISYGICGNAMIGIKASHCEIYFPLIDDCIKGLMCADCELPQLRRNSIFTSEGWLSTKNNSNIEFSRTLEKYGPEKSKQIFRIMYANYKNLIYMQSEEEIKPEMREAADEQARNFELKLCYRQASLDVYRRLLRFESGGYICRLDKGEEVMFEMFMG